MNLSKSFINSLLLRATLRYFGRRSRAGRCKKYRKVTHCIFDLDGTILDNQHGLDNAIKQVFEKYGQTYTPEWRLKVMGRTGRAMWEEVIKELKINADWRKMYEDYRDLVKDSLLNAPLRPGVERLVNHLDKHCVPMAIATSSKRASMERKTSHIQHIMKKFSHVVCGGDDPHVKKSKPSGEIYRVCATRFIGKPDPETCLVFEDSPIGIMAALSACMQVVGIPCPPTPLMALRHADEVVCTLKDFWPGKYGLPPFPEQEDVATF